jgi:hypothetical protein
MTGYKPILLMQQKVSMLKPMGTVRCFGWMVLETTICAVFLAEQNCEKERVIEEYID